MKQRVRQSNGNQTLMRLADEKKKVAIAALLISVMVIMWVRVLAKKNTPSASEAAIAAQASVIEEVRPKIKVTYIELPHIEGRNDVLTRDIFAGSKWEGLGAAANGTTRSKGNVKKSDNEQLSDTIEMIGKELKLEMIFSGKNPQASVCGMLVSPGGKLTVKYEGEKYEFKAVAISEDEVVLECKGVQVKLNMTRPTNSAN